jgi:hypothetical protein
MRVGFFNAAGLANKIDAVREFGSETDCRTVLVTETKMHRYRTNASHPFIAASSRLPSEKAGTPTKHGVALLANDSLRGIWQNTITVQATDGDGKFLVWCDGQVQFIGLYLPPTTDDDTLTANLQVIHTAMSEADKKPKQFRFVVGDLNIRVDIDSGEISCRRHRELVEIFEGSFSHFQRGTLTSLSLLDHALANNEALTLTPTVTSLDQPHQLYHGSDHCFLYLDFNDPTVSAGEGEDDSYWGYNVSKLNDKRVFEQFGQHHAVLTQGFQEGDYINLAIDDLGIRQQIDWMFDTRVQQVRPILPDSQSYIDILEKIVIDPVTITATSVIGISERKGRKIPPVHPSDHLKNLRIRKNQIIEEVRQRHLGGGRPRVLPSLEEQAVLTELQEEIEKEMTLLRNNGVFKFFRHVDSLSATELSKMLRSLQTNRMKRRATLPSEAADMESYKVHFESQYTSPDGNGIENEWPEEVHQGFLPIICESEICTLMRKMTTGKAPGPSRVPIDLFKACSQSVSRPIALLFNEVLRLNVVPSSWKRANLVPIPKKPNPNGVGEHRPISLTEHLRKLFEHTIHPFISEAVEPLNAGQCGFRADRSTLDQAATLNEKMLQFRNETGRHLEVAFLDIKAAYDSVDRRILWRRCLEMKVPVWTVNILQQLFDECESKVCIRNRESGLFSHRAGLMQGSVVSPTLYSIFVNSLADELDAVATLEIGDRKTGGLFYADDIALMAESPEQMRRLLQVCEHHSMVNNYRFNPRKCETFADDGMYQLYGIVIPSTRSFKYLGIWFNKEGIDWPTHIRAIIAKAREASLFFKSVGCNGYGMGERTKVNVFKLFIRSRMEYGLAIMPRDQAMLSLWDKAQNEILRGLFSVGRTTSTCAMRTLLHLQSARNRHDELSCRWICALSLKTGAHFLIERVLREATACKLAGSCFKYVLSNRNKLLQSMRSSQSIGKVNWEQLYQPFRNAHLFDKLQKDRVQCNNPDAFVVCEDGRPRQAYKIGQQIRSTRRIIVLYLLGRLMGKPPECQLCGAEHASQNHVMTCTQTEGIEMCICGERYEFARWRIVEAIRLCAPQKASFYDKMLDYL